MFAMLRTIAKHTLLLLSFATAGFFITAAAGAQGHVKECPHLGCGSLGEGCVSAPNVRCTSEGLGCEENICEPE